MAVREVVHMVRQNKPQTMPSSNAPCWVPPRSSTYMAVGGMGPRRWYRLPSQAPSRSAMWPFVSGMTPVLTVLSGVMVAQPVAVSERSSPRIIGAAD